MKAIRIEINGAGLFHAAHLLDDVEMDVYDREILDGAIKEISDELILPPVFLTVGKNEKLVCFFTEHGMKSFETALDDISKMFDVYGEKAGIDDIAVIEIPLDIQEDDILYRDEYQVVIKDSRYRKLLQEQTGKAA